MCLVMDNSSCRSTESVESVQSKDSFTESFSSVNYFLQNSRWFCE